jgi:NADH-quinone oxidoreductase subunit A
MPDLVGYLLLFVVVGVAFILIHLLAGKLVRPARPDPEKMTIYECGEPTIGSAWIQFDLRFYVVALLFVIFDVEVAFFFPWAVVFGKANALANPDLPLPQRQAITQELLPNQRVEANPSPSAVTEQARAAHQLAWFAFLDILIFFGVLLVGFAYLWKRGDLNWVRSTAAERVSEEAPAGLPPPAPTEALVGAGRSSSF